jgi:hypothetical protein
MSKMPSDFFDKAADARVAEKALSKKNRVATESEKEWQDFQKEIKKEIKDAANLEESDIETKAQEKSADQAYEHLEYEKRGLKLWERVSSVESTIPQDHNVLKKIEKRLQFQVEPDSLVEDSD